MTVIRMLKDLLFQSRAIIMQCGQTTPKGGCTYWVAQCRGHLVIPVSPGYGLKTVIQHWVTAGILTWTNRSGSCRNSMETFRLLAVNSMQLLRREELWCLGDSPQVCTHLLRTLWRGTTTMWFTPHTLGTLLNSRVLQVPFVWFKHKVWTKFLLLLLLLFCRCQWLLPCFFAISVLS